ncbi:MAG: peptidylprolyl isomerase [Alphaproteobacteria bacterium]|nr:peptidylprolyl isomerase [Alphaproteobacteria bacterium]
MFKRVMAVIICCMIGTSVVLADSAEKGQMESKNILVLKLKTGDVSIKLRPDLAPKHVARIKQLVADGAYNNVVFHRVIDGFMAQTGDVKYGQKGSPSYNSALVGTGSSKYPNLVAELSKEPFLRGVVGMARSAAQDSANSQFFICFKDANFLNGQYTVIGQVVNGMDAVDKIKKGNDASGAVKDPDVIIKASIE